MPWVCATNGFPREVSSEWSWYGCCYPDPITLFRRSVQYAENKLVLYLSLTWSVFWYKEGESHFTHAHVPLL